MSCQPLKDLVLLDAVRRGADLRRSNAKQPRPPPPTRSKVAKHLTVSYVLYVRRSPQDP